MLKRSIYYSSGIQDDGRTTKKEQVELAKDKEFIWNLIREIDAQYLRN